MDLKPKDAPDLSRFTWDDPFRFEDQLDEDERMLRDAARDFAQAELAPRVQAAYAEEKVDTENFSRNGPGGVVGGDAARGIWRAWCQLCHLRIDRARDRTRGQRLSVDDVGAKLAGGLSDLCLWQPSAAAEISAGLCAAI